MRVADALALARALGVDRLDAQLLLAHRLQRSRAWLLAHDDEALPDAVEAALRDDLTRRADEVPLAYLTGRREFHGLAFEVTPAVLVPRPETEELVDWALACIAARPAPRVADLGTGSGAIAVTIARHRPDAEVDAVDIDEEALGVAARNAAALGQRLRCAQGSWWSALAGRRYDLVVSNPPYIAVGDAHLAALRHEPRHALVSGADGLDDLRLIVRGAPAHLLPVGWLLVEHGFDQGAAVRALMVDAGLVDVQSRRDLSGHERCTGGRRPG